MSTLFSRRSLVFSNSTETPGTDAILDLRIHWLAAKIGTPVLPAGVTMPAPGETKLTEASGNSSEYTLTFAATHPVYTDTHYSYTLSGSLPGINVPYAPTDGPYLVVDSNGNYVQYLVHSNIPIAIVSNANITVLLDLSTGFSWPAIGSVVEPFNTLFDYIPQSIQNVVPTITDGSNSVVISGSYFTNTPYSSGATITRAPVAHSFELVDSSLGLTGTPEQPPASRWIRSINGVSANQGNINIKILP